MTEPTSRARLVDPSSLESGRGVTTTIPRAEIEEALGEDRPPELLLDVARRNGGADVEAHTIKVEWDKKDLEELLQSASGDEITLAFDRQELEQALETDVEGHGLREKALVLTVAAGTAAAFAGSASSRPLDIGGGNVATPAPVEQISDAASSPQAAPQVISDAASSVQANAPETAPADISAAATGGYGVSDTAQLAGDAATGGGYGPASTPTELVSDASGGAGYGPASTPTELVSDSALTGSPAAHAAAETPLISDAASTGSGSHTTEAASGGGVDISAPSPAQTGAIVGGVALLITGAGFALRGRRRAPGTA